MIEKEFRNEDPTGKAITLILFVVSLIGAGSLSVKIGLQGFPPLKMALFRSMLGILVVGGVGFYFGVSMRLRFEELPRLLLLAALQALHIITMNVGTQFTTASRSTICHTLYPIFVVLFGHFWLPGDRLSPTKLLGILAAFGGMFVALAPNLQGTGAAEHLIGDLIVTLSACLLAFRITFTKLFVQEIYPYRLLVWLLGISIPIFFVLSYIFEREKSIVWTLASSGALLYQGWVITGFCFLALTWVLRKYKASKLVVFSFLMPVSGVLFSNMFLGDALTFSLLAGTGLVATGIYLVNMQPKKAQ
ncbi:MAG: DMT family transporter [Candidatus Poribacteria bacterium]|nr:DMT family transporter [Candidatus Poribacteria bacterium]